jgi:hypothetical protein
MAAQLAFVLSLVLLAVSGLAFAASQLYGHGIHWADQICTGAPALCADPTSVGAVTAAVVAAYFILRELEV